MVRISHFVSFAYCVLFLTYSEKYMRHVVKPLEALLISHKRIIIKDSAVSGGHFNTANMLKLKCIIQSCVLSIVDVV